MMSEDVNISIVEAEALIARALMAQGTGPVAARATAQALVRAEAEGQIGHGFSRLGDYCAQVQSGKVAGMAMPVCSTPSPTLIHVDAGLGFAYPALDLGCERGISLARETGMALVIITRSHHCGALSVQVDRVARAGMIAMMFANAPAAMAPWGGKTAFFGTNPVAFACPNHPDPLVIDLSISRVARGKVMHAKKQGQKIPLGWALDRDGEPTTDPDAALEGTMLPIGEAKGSALALMIEIMASALTAGTPSNEASSFFSAQGPAPAVGQCLILIDPARQSPGFDQRLQDLLSALLTIEGARLPGTRRLASLAKARQSGLFVARDYIDLAQKLAQNHQ